MGNTQSAIKYPGYTLVSEDEHMILVKNEGGDHFVIKKFNNGQVKWTFKVWMIFKSLYLLKREEFRYSSVCLVLGKWFKPSRTTQSSTHRPSQGSPHRLIFKIYSATKLYVYIYSALLTVVLSLQWFKIQWWLNLLPGPDCLYLVLEHCEGGDLAQKIKHKIQAADTFSENEVRYVYRFKGDLLCSFLQDVN